MAIGDNKAIGKIIEEIKYKILFLTLLILVIAFF
tara:strand:- start:483 stop:584 length:102 start_codon:yes stop_codon:yes gene_type:complete